ncbi:MAG: 2Fe-2S iron-sulfur cluster-binding protein [Bacteroidetes bacterium]|jgi:ring-1,2-phenylacetyl-CoA epoxidase subunit PaaE|nr:2Fe-2S iron-sulfur cluster-binding protein [Bacteroidota bacterium]
MSKGFHKLTVQKVKRETTDTVTLTFDIPSELENDYSYKPGQYLTLKFNLRGSEVRRAYSMSSAPYESGISVTVKRVKDGLVSNHINTNIVKGDNIEVMVPEGRFSPKLNEENKKAYYLFGAGSGITPLMSILKTILETEPMSYVYLLYGNRNEDGIIFKPELDELVKRYTGQFFVTHTLSAPKKVKSGFFKKAKITWEGNVGRINEQSVSTFLDKNKSIHKTSEYFVCGPGGMIDTVENLLIQKEIDAKNIHTERFVNASQTAKSEGGIAGAKLIAQLDGKTIQTTMKPGKTILDALLDKGADAPYSCTAGACATCMAKVTKGSAKMDACFALDDDEVKNGFILTCQAHPTTNEIEVTFEV